MNRTSDGEGKRGVGGGGGRAVGGGGGEVGGQGFTGAVEGGCGDFIENLSVRPGSQDGGQPSVTFFFSFFCVCVNLLLYVIGLRRAYPTVT